MAALDSFHCISFLNAHIPQSQYVFIHDALDELITCGDTEIAAVNLFIAMNQLRSISMGKSLSGYEEQFEVSHIQL